MAREAAREDRRRLKNRTQDSEGRPEGRSRRAEKGCRKEIKLMEKSLQETYAPTNQCFGCGPANEKGLRIRSFVKAGPASKGAETEEELVCEFTPEAHHLAFPGVLNGGICGALLDCHSNWAAAYHLMTKAGTGVLPCTVTAEFAVTLKRPTPMSGPIHLSAKVIEWTSDRATVEATITAGGKVTATCRGIFVAVKEGHPAFHRW